MDILKNLKQAMPSSELIDFKEESKQTDKPNRATLNIAKDNQLKRMIYYLDAV